MKVVGYARVSTAEQAAEGISLEAHGSKIRTYCALKDFELADIVVDAGVSGAKPLSEREGGKEGRRGNCQGQGAGGRRPQAGPALQGRGGLPYHHQGMGQARDWPPRHRHGRAGDRHRQRHGQDVPHDGGGIRRTGEEPDQGKDEDGPAAQEERGEGDVGVSAVHPPAERTNPPPARSGLLP
jgi:hypothetical protein